MGIGVLTLFLGSLAVLVPLQVRQQTLMLDDLGVESGLRAQLRSRALRLHLIYGLATAVLLAGGATAVARRMSFASAEPAGKGDDPPSSDGDHPGIDPKPLAAAGVQETLQALARGAARQLTLARMMKLREEDRWAWAGVERSAETILNAAADITHRRARASSDGVES